MKKIIRNLVIIFITATAFSSCGKLDLVAKDSERAFAEMLEALPQRPYPSADTNSSVKHTSWTLSSPDNPSTASFTWTDIFDGMQTLTTTIPTAYIEFDAAPFIAAGLDPKKLKNPFVAVGPSEDYIVILGYFETEKKTDSEYDHSAVGTYHHLVSAARSVIGYHAALDHYGITLGDGNLFEWAKNMSSNDKDIVFVLNPQPFIDAGVDVNNIDGWIFGKVTVDDENGKPVQVDKLLKPFNLK
ncbi:MAG: hypothetical protein Ta2G_02310 [Termitinemataceae bacterium]|nr:MAG: hypothetical protein Ta2G_02310 [Termitinemataceae bacterium]